MSHTHRVSDALRCCLVSPCFNGFTYLANYIEGYTWVSGDANTEHVIPKARLGSLRSWNQGCDRGQDKADNPVEIDDSIIF